MGGDLSLEWGGDLGVSPSGDYAVVTGYVLLRQRLIRRLSTNARVVLDNGKILDCEDLHHSAYGASLGRYIGTSASSEDGLTDIENIARQALAAEPLVDQTQPASIAVSIVNGGVLLNIGVPINVKILFQQ